MAKSSFVRGVRTRFRNLLETEMNMAREFLMHDPQEIEFEEANAKVTKCLERLKVYNEKVELQSEKLVSCLEDEDQEIGTIIDSDCTLCSLAMDTYLDLSQYKEKLISSKEAIGKQVFEEKEDSKTHEVLQLQKDMQKLFATQQDMAKKSEADMRSSVKLPKIEIPIFNGDKTKWIEFWDSFQCAVNDNKWISNVEKFTYLKSKLVGEAKSVVTGLALSNENYKVAVDILKKRFGNRQEIIDVHYSKLMSLSTATDKVSSLRDLLDHVQRHLRSLEVLGQNVNQDVFVSMIRSKLPEDVLIQMEIQNGVDKKWTVESLCEKLRECVVARERSVQGTISTDTKKGNTTFVPNRKVRTGGDNQAPNFKSSAQALTTTDARQGQRKFKPVNKVCRYCGGNHWSDECNKYKSITERKNRIKGSCYKCLRGGHSFKQCRTKRECVYCGELNVHHRSLCPKKFQFKRSVEMIVNEVDADMNVDECAEETGLMSMKEMVLMQTALTCVSHPESMETMSVRLLMDSGSHRSYISESLARKLSLEVEGEEDIHIVTFGSQAAKTVRTQYTRIDLKLKNGHAMNMTVNIVPNICGKLQRRPLKDLSSDRVQDLVKSVDLADVLPKETEISPIDLLVGNDYYLDIMNGEKIEVKPGLYLLSTKLGWVLSGRTQESDDYVEEPNMLIITHGSDITNSNLVTSLDASVPGKPDIEDFWNVESIGIVDNDCKTADMKAMEYFKETLTFENKRYQVTWPWKQVDPDLPMNRELATGRLRSTINRLKRKPNVLQKYDDVIQDQLDKGIIERVEKGKPNGLVHYIPHHAVITPTKSTTKLRVVYDASAKTRAENKSLNDCLYRGPVMLNDLSGILMRFRMHPIAIVADIEKAFLQIGLQEDQRDVTRFVWLKDINNPSVESKNIQEYRFTRVPFGVISSPFLLGATIESHLDLYTSGIANQIKNDIYVDNLITGTDTVSEAHSLYKCAKGIFNDGSMNLREWITNDTQVRSLFSSCDRSDETSFKVLGHNWDLESDTLSLRQTTKDSASVSVTKRIALKQLSSVFDPLGLTCPVLLRGKVFLQYLWSKNMDWDEQLNDGDAARWSDLEQELVGVSRIKIHRNIADSDTKNVEYRLMCFCDASEKAYAAAIYLHQTTSQRSFADLVFAKTRLAPIKKMTIPRLELLAVVIGLRCLQFVKEQTSLPITESVLWTDSQCVLHWIASDKQLPVFVRNRVKDIREHKGVVFAYVPTKENPADVASRGVSVEKLQDNQSWWNGPNWLNKCPHEWPVFDVPQKEVNEGSELNETKGVPKLGLVLTSGFKDDRTPKERALESPLGIDINRFSSVKKLLRATALALRFIRKLQKRQYSSVYLTSEEIKEAEIMWLQHVQRKHYTYVFGAIATGRKTSIQQQLGVYIDGVGILRCQGRLENANVCESARRPILLPKGERYTNLVIAQVHTDILHSGISQTLSSVRMRFWIPHGRAAVKSVVKSCCVCRRHEGGPYKLPPMCALPKSRVHEAKPFSKVGLDYLGPLYIKEGNEQKKVWICLFSCLVTRAVHLELVSDMSTTEFLLCFKRFIAQRGTPTDIFSDNAAQFKTASTFLDHVWNRLHQDSQIWSYVSNAGIKWIFNVELAPWMGGFYERLVGLVKRSLRKTIGRRMLTIIQLQTLLKEIESVLNSRPLVYVGDDVNSHFPITPSHFLSLNPNTGIPEIKMSADEDYQPVESTTDKLLTMWKKGQKLLDTFWNMWSNDYLLSLRERTQSHIKTGRIKSQFEPNVTDVVLVKDTCSRGQWKFGKVIKLTERKDGQIRSATVILPSGKEIRRPLNLLYPLEVSNQRNVWSGSVNKLNGVAPKQDANTQNTRPMRQAAVSAAKNIKQIIKDNCVKEVRT